MADECFSDSLQFSCAQCSACCRYDPGFVYLSFQDLKKLQTWACLSEEEFIAKYCRWIVSPDGYEKLALIEKSNYDCILWDMGCIAYEYRPFQCSSYPFWISLVSDEEVWNATAKECPGMNAGEKHDILFIENLLQKKRDNPIVCRKMR